MNIQNLGKLSALAIALVLVPVSTVKANALTANITYFSISESDPDANHLCCTNATAEVANTLGPNGLPVLLGSYIGIHPNDVNGSGELTYWSPSFNPHVTQTGTGVINLPFDSTTMFNPNGLGSSDGSGNGYLSAIISATLTAPTDQTVSFTLASDDNAFVYIDGQIVCNNGGVHPSQSVGCISGTLTAGDHFLQLFYDDLNQTQAELHFSVDTVGVTTTAAVPEPSSLALLAAGIVGLGVARRSKRK